MSTISKMETPTGQEETAILLEEQARRIATLQKSLKQAGRIHPNEAVILQEIKRVVEERNDLRRRLENAEMMIERLKREVKELDFSVALHDRAQVRRVERAEAVKESLTSALRDIKKNVDDWNLQDYVTIRRLVNAALRTAEESSVVGLIDSTPAKQFPNAVNADGYEDILFDIEASLRAKTEVMKRLLESQTLSPELAALGRELVRLAELAEKSLGEVTE